MSLSILVALATSELRSCRRLVRAWVFVAIASIFTLGQWITLTDLYDFKALSSPVYGLIGPRYTFSQMGGTMLLWFSIGIVFLTFDLRNRDRRDRINEVLDALPISDFQFVLGRLMGIVLFMAIPAAVVATIIFAYGVMADTFNFPGTPIEPVSFLAFLFWDIFPNLFLWGALTLLVSHLLRFRVLVVLVVLLLLGIGYVLSSVLPFSVSTVLATHSGANAYPSELAPIFGTFNVFFNRTLMLVLAGGCLAYAALLLTRIKNTRTASRLFFSGVAATVATLCGVSALLIVNELRNEIDVERWASLHNEHRLHSSTDIQDISGNIEIRPGNSVHLELSLTMAPSQESNEEGWLFSMNPGYRISEISINGSLSEDYRFKDGLLQIPRNFDSSPAKLNIVAHGKPDERFAYLDSSLDWKALNAIGAKRLFLLGQQNYIFHPDYVALVPGVSWIPTSGSAYGTSMWESRPRDFYQLDIEVTVPKGWLVAGPGRRESLDSTANSRYRLHTQNPIPEFALLGSKFDARSTTFDGVEYELLLSKKHTKNFGVFYGSTPVIEEWINERAKHLRDSGFQFPFAKLSFVEVPSSLRVYGGGWRMDSVYSAPGIQMIRESGFPVAPFSRTYSWARVRYRDQEKEESDFHKYMLDQVITYFADDLHGGDPFDGIARNFVDHQTSPTGNGATALRFLANELSLRLTTRSKGYFSVYTALTRGTGVETYETLASTNTFGTQRVSDWRREYADRPSAWEVVEQTPLSSINYTSDAENIYHALLIKVQRVADAVVETYGEELVGAFLRELVSRFQGRSYTENDFHQTALDVGVDFEAAVGDWLNELGMAGFVVQDLKVERIADERGERVYQTSFTLVNGEPIAGVAKVIYDADDERGSWYDQFPLGPVRVDGNSAVRVAFQSHKPPRRVWLEPRLAFNRDPIRLDIPELDNQDPTSSPTLAFTSPIEWEPTDPIGIIVDDLDDGFSVENPSFASQQSSIPRWLEHMAAVPKLELDRGLPIRKTSLNHLENRFNPLFSSISSRQMSERILWWFRQSDPTSFGKYRRTYAGKPGTLDQSRAIFSASLPFAGHWKLDYHIPISLRKNIRYSEIVSPNYWGGGGTGNYGIGVGKFDLSVQNDELEAEVEFDGYSASPGWNEIGVFELDGSDVEVVVIEGYGVVADAIRWSPVKLDEEEQVDSSTNELER